MKPTRCRWPSASTAWEGLVEDGIPADVLLPGTGACALPDAVTLAHEALAVGAPGVLALPPFYYKGVSDDGLFRFFAELIERVGDDRLRLFLYHIPPMAQVGFTPELIGRLLDAYPGVVGGDEGQRRRCGTDRAAVQGVPQLTVFAGSETLPAGHAALGRRRLHLRHVQRHGERSRERVYDLWAAGDAGADAEQASLTETRGFLEGFPRSRR